MPILLCRRTVFYIEWHICITACIHHIRVCMYGRISKFSTKWINWSTNNEHLASMPHILQAWKDSNASTECKPTERTLIFSLCTPFFFLFALFLFSGGGDDAVQIGSSTYINCPSVSSVAKWMSLCMLFISVRSCVLHYIITAVYVWACMPHTFIESHSLYLRGVQTFRCRRRMYSFPIFSI